VRIKAKEFHHTEGDEATIELSVVVAQLANRQFAPKENESLDSISDLTYSMFADV